LLFDEAPKTKKADLFDFEDQLSLLVNSIKEDARLITIFGLRRTGKSSLMLTGLNQAGLPFLLIDARQFAEAPAISRADFIQILESTLNEFLVRERKWSNRIIDAIKSVRGVEVSSGPPPSISLSWAAARGASKKSTTADLARVFGTLGKVAEANHTKFVIALDEAQELRRLAGFDFSKLLAHIYDYVLGIQIVLTGSQVGFLYEFIGIENPRAPLYGRARVDIQTDRLTPALAKEFLIKGMQQISITEPSEELLNNAVKKLDGIIGWLTYLGAVARRTTKFNEKIIDQALEEASKLAGSELDTFLALRPLAKRRYLAILSRLVQTQKASWSEIKRSVQLDEGRSIPDVSLSSLLNNLVKGSFISKGEDGTYSISDPVLANAIRQQR
jgi:AAA+ ATPase superfamily predicted ATPase